MDQSGINFKPEKMELVVVTHIVDAITFWAQNVTDKANEKMEAMLSEKCPTAQILMARPSPQKVYGARYSKDRCWYRCTVQQKSDDKFFISYIDYGNKEILSRSDLVELPEDLQAPGLAKKYKFWGFHVSSEEETPLYSQGRSFLHNIIHGKKLRVHKKSVCFDGTILVQAFQGNLDIGEELLKFKFAKLNLPGNRDSISPLREDTGLWPGSSPPRELGTLGSSPGCMPKLRPIFSDQKPQIMKEQKTIIALQALARLNIEHNEEVKPSKADAQQNTQETHKRLNDTNSELQYTQRMSEVFKEKEMEIMKLKKEGTALQQHSVLLGQQLEEARLELKALKGSFVEKTEHNHPSTSADRITQLSKKVDSLRKLRISFDDSKVHLLINMSCNPRDSNSCSRSEDHILEAITIIMNYRVTMPLNSQKLEVLWENYNQTLEKLKACQTMGEMECLVNRRNEARAALSVSVDDFLQEVDELPVNARLERLTEVGTSLTALFGSVLPEEQVDEHSFEKFCEWRREKHQKTKDVQKATDEALMALSNWAARLTKFFCLLEKTLVTGEDVADGVCEILMNAEAAVCEELNTALSKSQETKIVLNAFHKAMQDIRKEQILLEDIRQKYELNMKFKQEVLKWQNGPPKLDELFAVKKHIRSLRSQLRWKLVEVSCLEEAEDLDLPEILKKKEEITETRNALFREISHEQREYFMLCDMVNKGFPELPMIYPDADINSYKSSAGLLLKSLDRDMFDAEPMKELSGRRPLLSTDFQGQKVVLKCYTVDEESEEKMLKQAAQYHTAQQQNPSKVVPLIALFCGKSDPLAYVMVPHYSNASLRTIQKSSPLSSSEIKRVMRGVALGLQGLHAVSVTHASLHPNNVFVLGREKAIVGDYDFTKTPEQRATDSGMVAGSISLVAPELRKGHPLSPATDMYAFGGILLWLHVPDFNATLESENQNVQFTGLHLDENLQILLPKLLISSERLSAPETLKDAYLTSADF
ncbi:serine/threonine-protein kinase 31-like isoform X2 [Triplophysa dalaica]|uniref:serine/threonine-protein kinase 31-like isoform X2 n=1 Tax=Triplophysa dalaica TaxID=1582913 RepID=UPI0024DF5837|nr:serine/threonine-protein kinase 31-like isoform X2 [Triplophysa dalaica]